MEIKEVKDKIEWENFLYSCKDKTFLQSWNWGEFQKKIGNKIWRFGIYAGDSLKAVALVIKIKAKRGTFLFIPHGPVITNSKFQTPNSKFQTPNSKQIPNSKPQVLEVLLEKLKEIGREERASFIRVAPVWTRIKENQRIFKNLGLRKAPIHIHPELTWELDITLPEDILLANMRKTTRYLIKRALRDKDIQIFQSQDSKDLEIFYKLYNQVVARHKFIPFSLDYLKNEFSSFLSDNEISLFLGKYKGEIISSAIIVFWQNIAFYHHGASSLKYPKVPVSYLLQWEVIREAKQRGCQLYNFWGITDIDSELSIDNPKFRKHPWAGLTLFKTGFGGYRKEYVKTQDLPLSGRYWLTFIFEEIRRKKRRL